MAIDNLEIVWRRLWLEIRDLQQHSPDNDDVDNIAARKREERIVYLRRKARRIRETLRN